jgi:hypothetical protein
MGREVAHVQAGPWVRATWCIENQSGSFRSRIRLFAVLHPSSSGVDRRVRRRVVVLLSPQHGTGCRAAPRPRHAFRRKGCDGSGNNWVNFALDVSAPQRDTVAIDPGARAFLGELEFGFN